MARLFNFIPFKPKKPLTPPLMALRSVTSKSGKGVYASSDTLFKGAVFGRDSLEVAEDLMRLKPRLVRHILLTLASLQGIHSSDLTEEEHGKIIHEYRTNMVDGKPLDKMSKHIFHELSSRWGGTTAEMRYYGSIDATPHFIRTLGHYVDVYGPKILKSNVRRRDGSQVTVLESLNLAIDWLTTKLADSSSGLLEYRARNPEGIANQVWKDSREFYVHENGQLANHKLPIASVEVQGLAYDALIYACRLLPNQQDDLKKRAHLLRDRTIELLWLPKRHYFALGLDHRADDSIRVIRTMTANPAELLDSSFFDDLPDTKKEYYVSSIVRHIMGSDFLTDAGVRSRSLSDHKIVKFWDYHGSFTSWPKETHDIARGLSRQGFPTLADELENRVLNVVRKSRGYPEFVYVDFRGRVLAGPPSTREHGAVSVVQGDNKPEIIQAWTVSAILYITSNRNLLRRPQRTSQQTWQKDLETEVLGHIPHVPRLRGPKELTARYPDYPYKITHPKLRP